MIEIKNVSLNEVEFYNKIRNNYENYFLLNYGSFKIEKKNITKMWITKNKKNLWSIYYKREIVGYIKLASFSPGEAFSYYKEVGIFIDENYRGLGIGKKSLKKLLRLDKYNFYIARVSESNYGSKKLFKSAGFKSLGKINVLRKATKRKEKLFFFVLDNQ